MAVTLNIPLTDPEQATVSAWIDILRPGLTPAEKKTLLERHARRLLREDLTGRLQAHRAQADRDAENAQRQTEAAALPVEDVFEVVSE